MGKKANLKHQISEIKRLVEHGQRLIAAQRRIVAVISEGGYDAAGAKRILESYESAQQTKQEEMDRLKSALKEPADSESRRH
jgi:uncharacterized protein (UPF0335 family)